ncbi:MAG TPA: hypothetical protein VK973_05735 [Arenicellales bacterium]|nr:hypothetical protein [Arenicellales bacterium]
MLVVGVVLFDLELNRDESVVMLGLLALFLAALAARGRKERWDTLSMELEHAIPAGESVARSVFWTIIGLVVLLISSRVLVVGAVDIARAFHVSDLVIGLTIVAIGTSLPEAAAAFASARRNEPDIAIGNVLGSNTFNMFGVVGVAGVIQPAAVDVDAVYRDWPVMVAAFALFILFSWGFREINRIHGVLFLAGYAAYLGYLGWTLSG